MRSEEFCYLLFGVFFAVTIQPAFHGAISFADHLRTFRKTPGFTADRQKDIASRIPAILFACDKTAIGRRVIPVVIGSIQLQAIFKTIRHSPNGKRIVIMPIMTNGDTACPIIFVLFILRVFAASGHITPAYIQTVFRLAFHRDIHVKILHRNRQSVNLAIC